MAHRDTSVSELCRELGIRPVTRYRYVGPQGELREQGRLNPRRVGGSRPRSTTRRGGGGRRRIRGGDPTVAVDELVVRLAHPGLAAGVDVAPTAAAEFMAGRRTGASRRSGTAVAATGPRRRVGRAPDREVRLARTGRAFTPPARGGRGSTDCLRALRKGRCAGRLEARPTSAGTSATWSTTVQNLSARLQVLAAAARASRTWAAGAPTAAATVRATIDHRTTLAAGLPPF